MADQLETCVDYGLKLSKRIYYGKELPPAPEPGMSKSSESLLPKAVMVYAVVPEPDVVDNPDVPSYQPYVHGRCDPPALIPLHMHGAAMEVDCYLDHASVSFSGKWRVHCIKSSRKCDCRVAIPMGDQGSILGLEVDIIGRSYHSQLIAEETEDKEKVNKGGDGPYLKGNIYTFKIPQVGGGIIISVKVTWSQKLAYSEGQFCLNVPFSFPAFVNPVDKKISKREKIMLNVNSGFGKEILCKSTSHALKELRREVGKMGFLYEGEVPTWSSTDFNFSYLVSKDLFGSVFLQSPLLRDFDERQMFCLYLFPGNGQRMKAFKKDVIFIIDISGSMKGAPFDNAKSALISSLSKLNSEDSFNIIAFNGETYLFSSILEPVTQGAISKASQWLSDNLTTGGGTNILLPLKQAMNLLAETTDSIPLIFLITDGSVEDERDICNFVKESLRNRGSISPRLCTFGIGIYCNHYFLQMLAQIGRGYFDSAYDADSIDFQMQRLFATASSIILTNITIGALDHLDSLELLPFRIPDLSCGSPLVVSGRYTGNFPDSVKINGILADMRNFTIELKTQIAKDVQLDKVLARRQIDVLTTNAWMSGSKDLQQKVSLSYNEGMKNIRLTFVRTNRQDWERVLCLVQSSVVAKVSLQTGVPSEYTHMILHQTDKGEKEPETMLMQEVFNKINSLRQVNSERQSTIFLGSLGVGFGNLSATAANIPPGTEQIKSPEGAEMLVQAASTCCSRLLDRCCCGCFIQACSHVNGQCYIVLSQLCAALACFECLNCCYELCECM